MYECVYVYVCVCVREGACVDDREISNNTQTEMKNDPKGTIHLEVKEKRKSVAISLCIDSSLTMI